MSPRKLESCWCEGQLDLTDLVDNEHIPGSMHAELSCERCQIPLTPDETCFHCDAPEEGDRAQ